MAKTNSREIFEEMPVLRAIRTMAIPTIFSQIIILVYNLADTFFVGRTNNPYMVAAASLILPVFNICLSLTGLTGVGGGALISRLLGENREQEAKKVSAFVFYLSILVAAVFSAAMLLFMDPILKLLGTSSNTYLFAKQYAFFVIVLGTDFLRVRVLATPLMFGSFFTVYLFQSFGEGHKSLFLGIMRWAVFNIPMLLVLNHFFGMYGIVWSQVCADILTVTLSCAVYFRYKKLHEKTAEH